MKRYLQKSILKDLPQKIVLITGPRQCGKTTLAKQLSDDYDYFNYDLAEDRIALNQKSWNRKKELIIFDELHKMDQWKRWLKGVFDTEGIPPQLLVTGSAKLDVFRKVGDSLAGRFFQYRLHPLDLKEALSLWGGETDNVFERLWLCSGFPEPFLKGDVTFYRRWRRSHIDIILKQDLIDMHAVRDIQAIETLVLLLKSRVGSTVSYANLANDLQRDPNTVKRWLQMLENLYIIFRVTPYSKNVSRSLLKEPKFYFYDHTYAERNDGARLENLVACALLKEIQTIEDLTGIKTSLHFLRTRDGIEIDFLITQDENPSHVIEVKTKDDTPASAFKHFAPLFPNAEKIQLVKDLQREKTFLHGLSIQNVVSWLKDVNLNQ